MNGALRGRRTSGSVRPAVERRAVAIAVLGCIAIAETVMAAVVIPAETPTTSAIEPGDDTMIFGFPLEQGEPIDMAHWARLRYPGVDPEEALARARTESGDPSNESVIVHDPRDRPALYATNAGIHPSERVPEQWFEQLNARRAVVAEVARSVGRIEVRKLQTGGARFFLGFTAGTAFVVKPSILMTNRHVTKLFADGRAFKQNRETGEEADVWVNFRATLGDESLEGARYQVTDILYVGPAEGHDVSLLRFDDPDATAPPPVRLQIEPPEHEIRLRQVFVGGYPFGNPSFFKSPSVKRIAPGFLKEIFRGIPNHPVLYHDCSTAKGNSGSPVVDLETGRVFGVHFAAEADNHAEVMWEVLKDPEIRDVLGLGKITAQPQVPTVHTIVLRPALLIDRFGQFGTGLTDFSTLELDGQTLPEDRLGERTYGVGQIRTWNGSTPASLGTGFLVAPGYLMTAGYIAREMRGVHAQVSFEQTFDATNSRWFDLAEPEFLGEDDGPTVQLAVVRLHASEGELPAPLPLDFDEKGGSRHPIAVVGFHYFNYQNAPEEFFPVFEGPEGVKRLSPGRVIDPLERTLELFYYDASTSSGSGGAPILDLLTGNVVGVHIGGSSSGNRGVSMAAFFDFYPSLREELKLLVSGP